MNQTAISLPAYLGLYAALLLAVACNAFLDIQYDTFGREMFFWASVFGWTLFIGWSQSRRTKPPGTTWLKITLVLGIFLLLVAFIPLWGFPRAGIYFLAMLQAASNCVTVTRRLFNLGLLTSLTLVLFAASDYRADWSMLFYLLPYVTAVVFTLSAEQIHIQNYDPQQSSLGQPSKQGQWLAILAATASVLVTGFGIYVITPQVNWLYLEWRYGQIIPQHSGGDLERLGTSTQNEDVPKADAPDTGPGQSPMPAGNQDLFPWKHWPTLTQMRATASNRHLPDWQAAMIRKTADLTEVTQQALKPYTKQFFYLWEALKHWLKQHWLATILSLIGIMLLAILLAFAALLKEISWLTWLLMQWEYLRFGILAQHASGERGARQYYKAMARILSLHELARPLTANTQEYLRLINRTRKELQHCAAEMTLLFEQARYGQDPIDNNSLIRMRELYRETYRRLD
ncbi:MAG: DUF4129 domain-containing protein [Methylococcaceae bacterium]|jgi:Ca2+/Na+ antiporter